MPTITDWLMVVITLVYVVATILICIFNFRSTKATREQVAEAKRQYEEINRAYITYAFLYEKRSFYGIRFTNHGKHVANHIHIQLKQEFIDSITEPSFSKYLKGLSETECVLGIGQSYDVYFGTNSFRQNPHKIPIEGTIVYQDGKATYQEPFAIDFEHYATIFSVNSTTENLLDVVKKQTIELERIRQELRRITSCEVNQNVNVCVSTDEVDIPPEE